MRFTSFDNIPVNNDWAFENVRSIAQWTHGYHRYPAKFLPNVVKKLIEQYVSQNDVVVDLFAGCGTTLVEAKVHGIESYGTDINPIATLITQAKINPIDNEALTASYQQLINQFNEYNENIVYKAITHERLDYWFRPEDKNKIAYIFTIIDRISEDTHKTFFLVCLSHILKNCSWWLQSSTKPQKDPHKNIPDPFATFKMHCQQMLKSNLEFESELKATNRVGTICEIHQEDARHTSFANESVDAIITSPPYVTSYEYADIHQLTGYWMEYFNDITLFRKRFIGTSYSDNRVIKDTGSKLGNHIVQKLYAIDKHIAYDVANYFSDMNDVAKEMIRILRNNGVACIVIGNTTLKEIHVKSAEVFYTQLKANGFKKVEIIKRNIPHKLMPTLRDKNTGKFTSHSNANCKEVYPDEYIIIVKK